MVQDPSSEVVEGVEMPVIVMSEYFDDPITDNAVDVLIADEAVHVPTSEEVDLDSYISTTK